MAKRPIFTPNFNCCQPNRFHTNCLYFCNESGDRAVRLSYPSIIPIMFSDPEPS